MAELDQHKCPTGIAEKNSNLNQANLLGHGSLKTSPNVVYGQSSLCPGAEEPFVQARMSWGGCLVPRFPRASRAGGCRCLGSNLLSISESEEDTKGWWKGVGRRW